MLGNSKMDLNQLDKCVKRHSFLSPTVQTSGFSNYSQKTQCDVPPRKNVYQAPAEPASTNFFSPFWRFVSHKRATCEGASATDRIEQAQEVLKEKGQDSKGIVSEMEVQDYLAKETGKDRLLKAFTKDHMGNSSPEFNFIYQVTLQSGVATFMVMTVLAGRQAKEEFITRNRATVFNTRFQAFRRMQDSIFLFSMKEGLKWAARVSLFSIAFMGISQSIAIYRNKSTPMEYCAAAAATIGALKVNMGLRGFAVGTGFGAVMGLTMGLVAVGAMKMMNETQEQRHYWEITKHLEKEKYLEHKGNIPSVAAALN